MIPNQGRRHFSWAAAFALALLKVDLACDFEEVNLLGDMEIEATVLACAHPVVDVAVTHRFLPLDALYTLKPRVKVR